MASERTTYEENNLVAKLKTEVSCYFEFFCDENICPPSPPTPPPSKHQPMKHEGVI